MKVILPRDELLRCREAIYAAMHRPGVGGQEAYRSLIDLIGQRTSQVVLSQIRGGMPLALLLNLVIVARWAQIPLALIAISVAALSDPRYWWGVAACAVFWINLNALQVRLNIEIAAWVAAYAGTDVQHATTQSPNQDEV